MPSSESALAVERAGVERAAQQRQRLVGGRAVEHRLPGRVDRATARAAAARRPGGAAARGPRRSSPACSQASHTSSASSRASTSGGTPAGLLEAAAAELDGVVEVPGQAERARAAQRDLGALAGRGGELDGLVQQRGASGWTCAASASPSSPRTSASTAAVGRRLGERAAQEESTALSGAPRRPARGGGGAQRGDGRGVAGGLGAQQVQRDALRRRRARARAAPPPGACQSARSPGAQARVERARDQRVRER